MIDSDMKTDINAFLRDFGLWIAIGVAIIVAVVIIILLLQKNKKVGDKKKIDEVDSDEWLLALGNKDNIIQASSKGSRLVVELIDKNKLDKEKLKTLGALSIIEMSNKITIVMNSNADKIVAKLQ